MPVSVLRDSLICVALVPGSQAAGHAAFADAHREGTTPFNEVACDYLSLAKKPKGDRVSRSKHRRLPASR